MFRTPGRTATRLSAMCIATGLAAAGVIGFAGAAHADGAKGVFEGGDVGRDIRLVDDDGRTRPAELLRLKVDGAVLNTYCIDFHTTVYDKATYEESGWTETSFGKKADKAKAKVKWILLNSYPTVAIADLKAHGGDELDEKDAAAATQAAIWHFTDGQNLDPDPENNDADIIKLYQYLIGDANKGDTTEPAVSLSVTSQEKSGKITATPGIGPFVVDTNAADESIDAKFLAGKDGKAKLVGADGKEITKVGDGDKLYVKPPADAEAEGEATIEVSGQSTVQAGRVFQGVNLDGSTSQLLIAADKQKLQVSDQATAKWGAPGKGPLPEFNARKDCADGGVKVTVKNNGDEDYRFTLDGKDFTVAPGKSAARVVKVQEDQAYKIVVTGADGKVVKEFKGTLDCKAASGSTAGGSTGGPTQTPTAAPAPVNPKPDLAATGSDGGNTPALLGGAGALVVVGGGLMFYNVRRRNAAGGTAT